MESSKCFMLEKDQSKTFHDVKRDSFDSNLILIFTPLQYFEKKLDCRQKRFHFFIRLFGVSNNYKGLWWHQVCPDGIPFIENKP